MAKISVNPGVVQEELFSEEEKVVMLKENTVAAYETGLEILERLKELEMMVEVIRISFFQKFPDVVRVRFSVVLSGMFLRSKAECGKDYPFVWKDSSEKYHTDFSKTVIARQMVDYIIVPKIEEKLREAKEDVSIVELAIQGR